MPAAKIGIFFVAAFFATRGSGETVMLNARPFHHDHFPRRILVRYLNPTSPAEKAELEWAVKRQLDLKVSPRIFIELDESPGKRNLSNAQIAGRVEARHLDAILTMRVMRRQPLQTLRPEYQCPGYCFELRDARTKARIWADNESLDWHEKRVHDLGDVAREFVDEMIADPQVREWRARGAP